MKKICWLTPDYFIDCDIKIISELSVSFDIYWIVILPPNSRFKPHDFDDLNNTPNVTVNCFCSKRRERNPFKIFDYINICESFKKEKPDVVYLNMSPSSPWQLPFLYYLKKNRTIVTAHQGRVHRGFKYSLFNRFLRYIYYTKFVNVNMFSKSQADLFREDYPKSCIYQFLLGLKDFGAPTNIRPLKGDIVFLSFGTINYGKSIETLIDAACILHEKGIKGFRVSINGFCDNWSWYQNRIKYTEIFQTDIRMIDNSEIPNLFNGAHYLVQPYRIVTQSGPTKIAFQYNLPVICSNLPGFTDEVVEGVNGFTFESENPQALATTMQNLIERHDKFYSDFLNGMKIFIQEEYSEEKLLLQYKNMFTEVISKSIKQ